MESIASWAAPVATTIAALMTASNLGSRVTGWGFGVFLIGSIAWMLLGIATGQSNLIWQNAILTALNVFGMWRWLGRQVRIEEGGEVAQEKSAVTPGETLFPVSLLSRASVESANGTKLGTAIDAMAGSASGRIAYVVVGEGGLAGVGERFRRLGWGQLEIDGERLLCEMNSLDGAQELEADNWPGR